MNFFRSPVLGPQPVGVTLLRAGPGLAAADHGLRGIEAAHPAVLVSEAR